MLLLALKMIWLMQKIKETEKLSFSRTLQEGRYISFEGKQNKLCPFYPTGITFPSGYREQVFLTRHAFFLFNKEKSSFYSIRIMRHAELNIKSKFIGPMHRIQGVNSTVKCLLASPPQQSNTH